MKKHLVMAVVPFLALGCGDDFKDENGDGIADGIREPDTVTVVTPATPKGTVSGQVLGTDLKPLADASVEITIGSSEEPLAGTTDAKGNFEFKGVPAGSQVLLTFTKTGYATLRATSTVPSSAGNVPINNANVSFGPVTLTRLDGSLRFLLVTPQGRPAANVRATLEASPAGTVVLSNGDNTTRVMSTVVVEATSDDQGVLQFQNIPSAQELARFTSQTGQYRLWVAPTDSNNDGVPEINGYVDTYTAASVVTVGTTRILNLPASRPTGNRLAIEGSNVAALRAAATLHPLNNMVRPGEPIYLYFNQPVQQGSVLARLTDEYFKESLPVTVTVGNGGYSATITPAGNAIQVGKEYNIDLRAASVETGEVYQNHASFFGGEPGTPSPVTIVEARYQESQVGVVPALNDGETVYINFSAPVTIPAAGGVQVFFDNPLDNVADATATGEKGSRNGFPLFLAEPVGPYVTQWDRPEEPIYPPFTSGYSTRYAFTFRTTLAGGLQPSQAKISIEFSNLPRNGVVGTYQSIWGQPIVNDLAINGLAVQPAPLPASVR
ncbi:carboxypeptidase-like regulatory domain-containing protein [Myxococcus sp. K38C18041901]|uniref:carboxypeptidase-like regulatory domain-containing protein n=1 Tax=Myxococcus guangdongensis TaxID=2906760 RepID=UPI0020A7C188|nr:carboxypeptidase-like regulatory domain-containing protein [Myxococcus guangdongensis]MCP3065494.1 carboxypeptidase-like regulatory domain-containing protein [Myxococcus guangdongensis]